MLEAAPEVRGALNPDFAGGAQMGKRYQDAAGTTELLCIKGGKGALAIDGALATVKAESSSSPDIGDHTIRQKLFAELQAQEWAGPWAADIVVRDGIVHLWFPEGHSEEEKRAVHIAAENIAGVRAVEEHIVQIPLIQAIMMRL